jgi:hypothetical protein
MSAIQFILGQLDQIAHESDFGVLSTIQWEDAVVIRRCFQRVSRGDESAWHEFLAYLRADRDCARRFRAMFRGLTWATLDERSWSDDVVLSFPPSFPRLDDDVVADLTAALNRPPEIHEEPARPESSKSTAIKYIEEKNGLAGHARIGRVTFSASGKTLYYAGRKLRSLKGGYKANYYDADSGVNYWISSCKQDGNDTHYPGVVEIDEDVRVEYWTEIRRLPEKVHNTKFRSEGKHSKRRPA